MCHALRSALVILVAHSMLQMTTSDAFLAGSGNVVAPEPTDANSEAIARQEAVAATVSLACKCLDMALEVVATRRAYGMMERVLSAAACEVMLSWLLQLHRDAMGANLTHNEQVLTGPVHCAVLRKAADLLGNLLTEAELEQLEQLGLVTAAWEPAAAAPGPLDVTRQYTAADLVQRLVGGRSLFQLFLEHSLWIIRNSSRPKSFDADASDDITDEPRGEDVIDEFVDSSGESSDSG